MQGRAIARRRKRYRWQLDEAACLGLGTTGTWPIGFYRIIQRHPTILFIVAEISVPSNTSRHSDHRQAGQRSKPWSKPVCVCKCVCVCVCVCVSLL